MVKLYVTLVLLADDVKFRLRREESGATAVEYGLLVGLIAAVIITVVALLGTQLKTLFTTVTDGITGAGS